MSAISTIRHKQIFDPDKFKHDPITIIGCGAVGSRLFMALIELGLTNITCIDFDSVEPHNLANQAFHASHIGKPKVDGLHELYVYKIGGRPPKEMKFLNGKLPDDFDINPVKGFVFLGVDSMAARREIVDKFIVGNNDVYHVFEGRMASTHGNAHSFCPHIPEELAGWKATLISDADAEVSVCGTSLSVGPTASILANMLVWQYINLVLEEGTHDRIVNFFLKPIIISTKEKYPCPASEEKTLVVPVASASKNQPTPSLEATL